MTSVLRPGIMPGVSLGISAGGVAPPLPTDFLQEKWSDLSLSESRDAVENPEYWARLIDLRRATEAKDLGIHPSEVFGERVSEAFYKADRFLKSIPIGEFQLSIDIIMEANRLAVHNIKPFWQLSARLFPKGYMLSQGGVIRKRRLFHWYGKHPLREERYQQLLRNEEALGVRFLEFPWNRDSRLKGEGRKGILIYPTSDKVKEKLQALVDWYNKEREKVLKGDPGAIDPIEIAAEFQIRYVALHPTLDGNGRTSRLLMTRILREFGLPPSVRISYASDIDLSFEEHASRIREGIAEFVDIAEKNKPDRIRFIGNRGFGTKIQGLEKLALSGIEPKSWNDVINFTSKHTEFVFSDDGFFYDQFGIPHLFREGKLIPIADKTYRLYAFGGKFTGEVGVKRESNWEHRNAVNANAKLMEAIRGGFVNPRSIGKEPYETIKTANREGRHHIYPWQIPLVAGVARIREDPDKNPFAVLCQNRGDPLARRKGGTSEFERKWFNNWEKVSVSDIIGQYEIQDLFYWDLAREIEQFVDDPKRSEILSDIKESRRKLHRAGRLLLRNFLEKKNRLEGAELAYLERHPLYRGLNDYLRYSRLGFKTIEEANRQLGDDKIFLLRAMTKGERTFFGFRSERDLRRMFDTLLPSADAFRKIFLAAHAVVKQRIKDSSDTGPKPEEIRHLPSSLADRVARGIADFALKDPRRVYILDQLATRVLANRLSYRGIAPEYDRLFVDMDLHASDFPPKAGVSFTVSPFLLFNPSKEGRLRFVNPMLEGAIYMAAVPKEDVHVQYGSKWRDQYEIYLKETMGLLRSFFAVRKSYEGEELKVLEGGIPEGAKNFLSRDLHVLLKDFP